MAGKRPIEAGIWMIEDGKQKTTWTWNMMSDDESINIRNWRGWERQTTFCV
jgi:hypothetical protein